MIQVRDAAWREADRARRMKIILIGAAVVLAAVILAIAI